MVFSVEITPDAEHDASEIYNWLVEQGAGHAGARWFYGLSEAMLSLAVLPRRCRLISEGSELGLETRELLYGKRPHVYRVLFTVEDETVTILHMRHGRQLPLVS